MKKPSTTASVLLGLLSGSSMTAASPLLPSVPTKQQFKVTEGGVKFKVTHFDDGRRTPYRLYFWDNALTGSSYRFKEDGDVVYFKAGSNVYYDRTEKDNGTLHFLLKHEKKHKRHGMGGESSNEECGDFNCAQCTAAVYALCDSGLPAFCGGLDLGCLHRDGSKSVSIVCHNYEGVCTTLATACDETCGDQPGESSQYWAPQ